MFRALRRGPAAATVIAACLTAVGADVVAAADAARGEYLVNSVAMCVQCHTPRTEDGELDRSRLLQGGVIPVRPPNYPIEWAMEPPALAGLAAVPRAKLVSILTTGRDEQGRAPRPPMPPFRLSLADAESIADYLAGLPTRRR